MDYPKPEIYSSIITTYTQSIIWDRCLDDTASASVWFGLVEKVKAKRRTIIMAAGEVQTSGVRGGESFTSYFTADLTECRGQLKV